jgi:hypothetical protein
MSMFNRLYGVKPGLDAPKLDRLLWFRGYYLRNLILAVPALALVLLFLPPWVVVLVASPWLIGFARLSAEIRNERSRR